MRSRRTKWRRRAPRSRRTSGGASLSIGRCRTARLAAVAVAPGARRAMAPCPVAATRRSIPPGRAAAQVAPFWLDRTPVTNAEFLAFVREHERWRRSRVSRLFADDAYLSSWAGDLELGPGAVPSSPSPSSPGSRRWRTAAASAGACRRRPSGSSRRRRPSEAAAARREASAASSRSTGGPARLPRVGRRRRTPRPARPARRDLGMGRGLQRRPRERGQPTGGRRETSSFCGGAAAAASDPSDYATFMRYAFRGSLEATHALHHLGFRCARSLP